MAEKREIAGGNGQGGSAAPLLLDEATRAAFWRGERLDLSPTELACLAYLAERAGETVPYEALLQAVWDASLGQGGSLDQVRSTVKRLRLKLAEANDGTHCLLNVRGVGYRFEPLPHTRGTRLTRLLSSLTTGRALIATVLLALLGWLVWRELRSLPGNPTTPVWFEGRQMPAGILWAAKRGQYCLQGPDSELYCFDTQEERAAALDAMLRAADPQGPEPPLGPGATPEPQPGR